MDYWLDLLNPHTTEWNRNLSVKEKRNRGDKTMAIGHTKDKLDGVSLGVLWDYNDFQTPSESIHDAWVTGYFVSLVGNLVFE